MSNTNSGLKTVGKNVLSLLTSELVGRILGMFILLLLPRYLGPVEYGVYSLAISFSMIFITFSGFGMDALFIKDVSRDKKLAPKYFAINVTTKILLAIVAILALNIIARIAQYPPNTVLAISILSVGILFSSIINTYMAVFRAFEKMIFNAVFSITRSALFLIGVIVIILMEGTVLWVVSLILLISSLMTISGLFIINCYFFKPTLIGNTSLIYEMLKQSTPFFLVGAVAIIQNRVDILMISKLGTITDTGLFNASIELINVVYIIPNLLATVLYPVFSRHYHDSSSRLVRTSNLSVKFIALVGIPASAGIFMTAPDVIQLIFGKSFIGSIPVLQVMSLGVSAIFIANIVAYILTATDRVKHVMWANSFSVILNIILNLLLIPQYGAVGAAVASLVCILLRSIHIYVVYKRNFKETVLIRNLIKPLIATAIMCLVILLVNSNLAVTILIGVVSYLVVLLLLRTINRDEVSLLKQMIPFLN